MKPPVVLIHDIGGDHLSWPAELRHLPGHYVMTVDLPGHGKSEGLARQSARNFARDIAMFLEMVGFSRAVFIGHGLGGAIALTLALDYPGDVVGMGLISSGPSLPIPSFVVENATSASTLPHGIRTLLEMSLGPQTPVKLQNVVSKRLAETRQTVLLGDLVTCLHFNVNDRLGNIHVPTLVVCGEADKLTPLRLSRALSNKIPAAALQTIERAGHLLPLEQPERLAKLIGVFLAAIPYMPGG